MKHLLSLEKLSRQEMETILADSVAVKAQRGRSSPAGGQSLGFALFQIVHPHARVL